MALFGLALLVGLSSCWTLEHAGLFGEAPWSKSAKQGLQFFLYGAFALTPALLLDAPHSDVELRRWERWLSLGLLLSAIYGLLQAVDFFRPLSFMNALDAWFSSNPSIAAGSHELYLGHRFVGIPRIRSTACEPLYFGSYLLLAVPIALAAAMRQRGRWGRAWRLSTVLLGSVCFVMTFSRGAYVAAAFGAGIAGLLWWRAGAPPILSRRRLISGAIATALVAVFVGALSDLAPWELPALLVRRLQQTFASHDMSNLTRFFAWEAGWRAFLQRPLVGHGWGSFGFFYYGLAPAGGAGAHFGWPVTNSIPIRILAELGILGTLLAAWCFWPIARRLGRLWLWPRAVEVGGFLSILWVIAAFQGLSHSQLQLPHLWVLGAICLFLPRFRSALV
jgi:O-antigen ligase